MKNDLSFNDYVRLSVDSGVEPLELRFFPYVAMDAGSMAYRTETIIHSVILGSLTEKDFGRVVDKRECGLTLFEHTIQHLINAFWKLDKEDSKIEFFSVRCPAVVVRNYSLYEIITQILAKNPGFPSNRLCIEFHSDILNGDKEKAATAMKDLKLLQVKSLIVDSGEDDFPLSRLVTVTPDYLLLSEEATKWAGNRNKPRFLSSMIDYVRSMDVKVFATGD